MHSPIFLVHVPQKVFIIFMIVFSVCWMQWRVNLLYKCVLPKHINSARFGSVPAEAAGLSVETVRMAALTPL